MDRITFLLSVLVATISCLAWLYGFRTHELTGINKDAVDNPLASVNALDPSWTFVYQKDHIYVSQKKESQSDFLAFRGEMISSVSASQILGAFLNASHTLKWADKLSHIEFLPTLEDTSNTIHTKKANKGFSFPKLFSKKSSVKIEQTNGSLALHQLQAGQKRAEDVVYQVYKMWPLPPRDFVFNRTIHIESSDERVVILYTTMQDARKPKQKGWVRTEAPYTIWTFQSYKSFCDTIPPTHNNKNTKTKHIPSKPSHTHSNLRSSLCTQSSLVNLTYISLESLVLMDDIQVPWLVNYIQRSWPYNTLKLFVEHARDSGVERVEKKVVAWE
ncbi:hypothetical protein EON65_57305 [archaeon]|nr:MAG: hypothetical protein EON65_57305 [archaeon]